MVFKERPCIHCYRHCRESTRTMEKKTPIVSFSQVHALIHFSVRERKYMKLNVLEVQRIWAWLGLGNNMIKIYYIKIIKFILKGKFSFVAL